MLSIHSEISPAFLRARIAGLAAFQDALAEVYVEYCDRRSSAPLAMAISDASETRDDFFIDWVTSDIIDLIMISLNKADRRPPYAQVDRATFITMIASALLAIEARFEGTASGNRL